MKMYKKSISILLTLIMVLMVTGSAFAVVDYGTENRGVERKEYVQMFDDVPTTHWAFEYISELVERNVLSGYPDGRFRPNNTVSRAEFAKIMVVAAGINADRPEYINNIHFEDMQNHWANPFVNAGRNYLTGYVSGGKRYFRPDQPALREDIAVAIVALKGYNTNLADLSIIRAMFKDYDAISLSIRPFVSTAVEKGLMSGYPDETFRPQNTVTRAEAATMLWRAYQYGKTEDIKIIPGQDATPIAPSNPEPSFPEQEEDVADEEIEEEEVDDRYIVDTLARRIGNVQYMTVDSENNIFFIDKDFSVKKYDGNKLSTILEASDFDIEVSRHSKYVLDRLHNFRYNEYTNSIILLGTHRLSSGGSMTTITSIVDGTVSDIVYDERNYHFHYDDHIDMGFFPDGRIYANASRSVSSGGPFIAELGGDIVYTDIYINGASIFSNGLIYNMTNRQRLNQYDFTSSKPIETNMNFNRSSDYVTTHNGYFYFSVRNSIYKMDLDGYGEILVSPEMLNVRDMMSVSDFRNFIVDSDDNIIFYDESNNALRKITIN